MYFALVRAMLVRVESVSRAFRPDDARAWFVSVIIRDSSADENDRSLQAKTTPVLEMAIRRPRTIAIGAKRLRRRGLPRMGWARWSRMTSPTVGLGIDPIPRSMVPTGRPGSTRTHTQSHWTPSGPTARGRPLPRTGTLRLPTGSRPFAVGGA